MDKIFLSYSFDPNDATIRTALGQLDTILRAHGLRYEDGGALGGGPLTQGVKDRIAACGGLISVFSQHGQPRADGTYDPSEWVQAELQHASSIEMPCIGVVFPQVRPPGAMLQDRERVDYDPANPGAALLKLMAIVGLWKESMGRPVTIRIEPSDLAQRLILANGGARCEARISREDGSVTEWESVRVAKRVGGAFVTVRAPGDSLIQLRAFVDGERWMSVEAQQWVQVPLEKTP